MTYDIALPLSQRPRYPNRCVLCERENPGSTAEVVVLISVRTRSISSELAESLIFGATNSSENRHVRLCPPACLTCARSINRQGWYVLIGQYAYPLLGVICLAVMLSYGHFWLAMLALFAGILWPPIKSTVWPPAIGATSVGANLIYEFRSADFSQEFQRLNCNRSESETVQTSN